MKTLNLDEALKRIAELEKEVAELKAENEKLRSRNFGGYLYKNYLAVFDFIKEYETGKTLMEIVKEGDISRRTAYRYLAYYRELQKKEDNKGTE